MRTERLTIMSFSCGFNNIKIYPMHEKNVNKYHIKKEFYDSKLLKSYFNMSRKIDSY
jgi:hypothetical protein